MIKEGEEVAVLAIEIIYDTVVQGKSLKKVRIILDQLFVFRGIDR